MITDTCDLTIDQLIDDVVSKGFDYVRANRECAAFSDSEFATYCIRRVLHSCQSGRDYLQYTAQCAQQTVPRATFFDALQSERRCEMTVQLGAGIYKRLEGMMELRGVDYLQGFPELEGFRVLAGDGHSITHACHAARNDKGHFDPCSTIYVQNLRTGLSMELAPVSAGGRRQHEWPVFRAALPALDDGLGSDWKSTLFVLDRAYIDNQFWVEHSGRGGHRPWHMITRFKKNMEPVFRESLDYDKDDEVNTGVVGASIVGFNNAGTLYEVEYEDPESGTAYRFLTTLNPEEIRPGVIAWLYFLRWRIEKTFDTFKNDFQEQKAWANGHAATRQQATYIAIAYNIARFLLAELEVNQGMPDAKVAEKYQQALTARAERAAKRGRQVHPLHTSQPRMAKLSSQFLRAIRNHIPTSHRLSTLLPIFSAMLAGYL
jgi:hypothetical protein